MKNKIITYTFLGYIIIMSILHITIKDNKISISERRELSTFPTLELNSNYITKLEKYFLDQFPYREEYRSIKANFNYKILHKKENNGIFLKEDSIYKSNYPLNKDSVSNFINKTKKVEDLLSSNNKKYIMIIPDKNYYLIDDSFLQIDYNYIYNQIETLDMINIDIRDILNKEDYYQTDTHWKQENLNKVVYEMSKKMNFTYEEEDYEKIEYNNFYGVYYGESALKRNPEKLTYLKNNIVEESKVKYLENNTLTKVYNEDKLTSLDAYSVYLDGATSYVEIVNDKNNTDKELIIFRDSFASSLTPLLIKYYHKITLVDNRYINTDNITKYLDFNNQDVLFIYSTLIVNTSGSLKG